MMALYLPLPSKIVIFIDSRNISWFCVCDHKKGTRRRRQRLINNINNFYKYSREETWAEERWDLETARTIKCHKIYDTRERKEPKKRQRLPPSIRRGSKRSSRDCVIKDERRNRELMRWDPHWWCWRQRRRRPMMIFIILKEFWESSHDRGRRRAIAVERQKDALSPVIERRRLFYGFMTMMTNY